MLAFGLSLYITDILKSIHNLCWVFDFPINVLENYLTD